jgi:hypothetical protein
VDGGLLTDQPADWPGEKEVRAYNARVRVQGSFADQTGRQTLAEDIADRESAPNELFIKSL